MKKGVKVGKRGQITIFIILGLILLTSITLFVYYRNLTLQEPEVVPPQFDPVREYVSSCLDITGRQAVELLGHQSGYVEIPDQWLLDRDSYISFGGILNTPYWYYMGESRIPSEDTIEQQISDYIEANIGNCLQDFTPLENSFTITGKRDIEVNAKLDSEDVRIEADFLLKVKSKADSETTYISDFSSILDVKLKKAYELAKKIMEYENQNMVIENATIDMMAMNPDIPESGMTFHCGKEQWYLSEIKEELSNTMKYQLSRVRIKNTNHIGFAAPVKEYEYFAGFSLEDVMNGRVPDRQPPEDAYEYFHYYWDVGMPENDLRAVMQYEPQWGMEIEARPSYGGVLRSNVGKGVKKYLGFMCINFYHFTYDVQYPVMGIISDEYAFNGDGFIFRFALPVLIKNNEGNRIDFGHDVYDVPLEYVDYCGDISGPYYTIKVKGIDEDGYSDMELRDVNISYDCYKYRCSLGKTALKDGEYKLVAQLPSFCSHGYIVAEKEGYLETRQQVLDDTKIVVPIKKLRNFTFDIVMHDYQSLPPAHVDSNTKTLKDGMTAILNIQVINASDFYSYRMYPFDSDTTAEMKTIELFEEDSKYYIDIMVTDEKFGMIGGYRANLTVSQIDIYDKNHVTFHVINYLPVPVRIEDQYELTNFLDENQEYKYELEPEFSIES